MTRPATLLRSALLALLVAACAAEPDPPAAEPAAPAPPGGARVDPFRVAAEEFERLRAAEQPAAPPPARPPPPLRLDAVRELFRRAGAFGLSGGVLVAQRGEIVVLEACGLGDHARGEPLRADAVFDVGSVSKPLTAAAVMALVDDGRLAVEDPITRFFADVPADKQAITVRHLLTHTAGFVHDVGDVETHPSRDQAVAEILASELLAAPGARQAYSNSGYSLLAAIVEIASGRPFEAYIRERLWLPLDMTRTGMVLADRRGAQVADGGRFDGPLPARRPGMWGPEGLSWLARGSGGMSSTMEELFTWCEALRTGRVLSHAARTEHLRPHAREPVDFASYYSYGWQITAAPDGSFLVTHNGSAGVHYDVVGILPEHEAVLVTFCTEQGTPWRDFPERVLGVLTGADEIGFPEVGEASEPLEDLAGAYRLDSGETLDVAVRAGHLVVAANDAETLRLFCPWPPAESEAVVPLGDRQALAGELFDGVARGDLQPLLSRLPAEVKPDEERAFWSEWWPRWLESLGAWRGADVIETVRVDDSLRTLVLLRFERNATVVGLVHSEGGRLFADTMPRRFLRDIALAPQGGLEFRSFHPQTRRSARVVFEGPPEARTLTFLDGAGPVSARRLGPR